MTVNDVSGQNASWDDTLNTVIRQQNEMYPALLSQPRVVGIITSRHGSRLYRVTPHEQSPNYEVSVPLPRHSLVAPQRSRWSPMVDESPDVRPASPVGSLESPSRTFPLERRMQDAARGSSNRSANDIVLPLECEARVLSNAVDLVGEVLFDLETFTRGDRQAVSSMIRRMDELSSLETDEGKKCLLAICGWPYFDHTYNEEDERLAAFAVQRFRLKHNGTLGDSMPARHYNRYLAFTKIIDAVLMCCDNND